MRANGAPTDVLRYRFLLWNLISRDLKVKYRRSALGLAWSVLNPLLMMLVVTAVFSRIFRFDIPYFPVFYLTGAVLYGFVVEATSTALTTLVQSAPLIRKVYVPMYVFPLEKVLFAYVNLHFSLVAVLGVILVVGMPLPWTALLAFVPMAYALVFSFGLGLLLASADVFFRDIQHLYAVWTTAWLYLTPVIYPTSILPEGLQRIVRWNPLTHYVECFRALVMEGRVPGLSENLVCLAGAVAMLAAGLLAYRAGRRRFILHV